MRWDVVEAPSERLALAQALLDLCSSVGWNRASMRLASQKATGNPESWRTHFPGGPREAIWFISEISDASMRAAFADRPAADLREVILERLSQNAELKPFVRRVMAFDLFHPIQALARMQRTSRVMLDCVMVAPGSVSRLRTTWLNLAYTAVVFLWLVDPKGEGPLTRGATKLSVAAVRIRTSANR